MRGSGQTAERKSEEVSFHCRWLTLTSAAPSRAEALLTSTSSIASFPAFHNHHDFFENLVPSNSANVSSPFAFPHKPMLIRCPVLTMAGPGPHPVPYIKPARPLYRLAATGLGASMWFFVSTPASLDGLEIELTMGTADVPGQKRRPCSARMESPLGAWRALSNWPITNRSCAAEGWPNLRTVHTHLAFLGRATRVQQDLGHA